MVPTSRMREPVDSISSGSRKPSPISISSPRLTTHFPAGSQGDGRGQQRGGVVVDDVYAARGGTARASAARAHPGRGGPVDRFQVELDVGRAAGGDHRVQRGSDSGARPRLVCTTTPVALMTGRRLAALSGSAATACSATCSGSHRTGSGSLLGLSDNGFHQSATQHALGLGEARVGEQDIGPGHTPSRITHLRSRGHGGGGRESNPPATESAAQRF